MLFVYLSKPQNGMPSTYRAGGVVIIGSQLQLPTQYLEIGQYHEQRRRRRCFNDLTCFTSLSAGCERSHPYMGPEHSGRQLLRGKHVLWPNLPRTASLQSIWRLRSYRGVVCKTLPQQSSQKLLRSVSMVLRKSAGDRVRCEAYLEEITYENQKVQPNEKLNQF